MSVPATMVGNTLLGPQGVAPALARARVPHDVAGNSCLLGERLFRDALVRERRRSYREGRPFAVVVLDATHCQSVERRWDVVLDAVQSVRRDIDLAGWLERDTVFGLLLTDGSAATARQVTRAVCGRLADRLGDRHYDTMSAKAYAHGATASHVAPLPPVDLLIDAFASAPVRAGRDAAKRIVDVLGALVLLALFTPVLLLAMLAVRVSSPGPVFFRQTRIGRRGEPFTMLKLRTMRAGASEAIHADYATWFITASSREPRKGNEVFKLTHDPRITTVGNWLRRTSLDELPQFWNVLRGDMSLVGPRPPLPVEVDRYQPWHRRRVLEARPGITGSWQVRGRSRTTFDEMVRMDLEYARTWTIWMDLKILAATPLAMVKGAR